KPTLQKSLPCANAQATLCGWTQTHIIADRGEGRTHNRGFYAMLADVVTMSCTSLSANIRLTNYYLAFCC
ncbi:MAG TPA: hypothetical protein PLP80_13810, partial [Niabella sp.]|nr:hypothetical protein [Niabella sp.]